jgi:hypothetical protein
LTQAIENIASVSEENSAAVEEVSASTEEVSAQVEEVSASAASMMEMAQNLQQVVAQFTLDLGTPKLAPTSGKVAGKPAQFMATALKSTGSNGHKVKNFN